MEKNARAQGADLSFMPRVGVAWLLTALLLLLISTAIITLADLKASCFAAFGAAAGFLAAAAAGFNAKRNSDRPVWLAAGISAIALTIFLLTIGFLISDNKMQAEGILTVVITTGVGCFVGAILASHTKKLQKKNRIFRGKKRKKLT